MIHPFIYDLGSALTTCAMVYSIMAWFASTKNIAPASSAWPEMPPVTLLKPLCGAESETYECLRSFCDQDYPNFEVVFGVADADDPVIAIVKQLQQEFPQRTLILVIDDRQHGSSRKVSNLLNMVAHAQHPYFVIADSDVRVGRHYLRRVTAPLLDPNVGIVTCPYRGVPRPGMWASLGALFINEWFMPSVRVTAMSGSRCFAFGVTIALSRKTLARIGGFIVIADQLADDYRLGELTRRLGLRTVLSEETVETYVVEKSLGDLVRHELRWLQTIRAVRPLGYALAVVTFGIPVAALGTLMTGGAGPSIAMLAITFAARLFLHFRTSYGQASWRQLAMLPMRDGLSLSLWTWSLVTRRVYWRNDYFLVNRDGSVCRS